MNRIKVGQTIQISIYGKLQPVTVLAVHPFGTIDVQTQSGRCFRVSGLRM